MCYFQTFSATARKFRHAACRLAAIAIQPKWLTRFFDTHASSEMSVSFIYRPAISEMADITD